MPVIFPVELYSQELNRELRKSLVGAAFTGDRFKGDLEKRGAKLTVYSPSSIALEDYVPGADISVQPLNPGTMEFTVDQAKAFAYEVDDVDQLSSVIDVVNAHVEEAQYAFSDTMDQHIFSTLVAGAATELSGDASTAEGLYQLIQEADVALSDLNVPRQGRRIAMAPAQRAMVAEFTTDAVSNESALREGWVGRIQGFDLYESGNVGANMIYAGHAYGSVFASRLLDVKLVEPTLRFSRILKGLAVYQAHVYKPEMGVAIDIASE